MSITSEKINVLVWKLQYDLLFEFALKEVGAGSTKAVDVISKVSELNADPITKTMDNHLILLLRLVDDLNDAITVESKESSIDSAKSKIETLRSYVNALLNGTEVPCPLCSVNTVAFCNTCGGNKYIPTVHSVLRNLVLSEQT